MISKQCLYYFFISFLVLSIFSKSYAVDSQVFLGMSSFNSHDDSEVKSSREIQTRVLFDLSFSKDTQIGFLVSHQGGEYGPTDKRNGDMIFNDASLKSTDTRFGLGSSYRLRSDIDNLGFFFDAFYIPYSIGRMQVKKVYVLMRTGSAATAQFEGHYKTEAILLG
ncbi:MAG: hypothetical protein KA436_10685, partial [Oligoflexales bacterium]|nr:hypothetical protein [Oligoflexales bacterium]